jgi:O-antigen/teichoic acid export membrane protein
MFFILIISAKILSNEQFGVYNYILAFTNKKKVNLIFFNAGIILVFLIVIFCGVLLFFADELVGENGDYIKYLIPTFFFLPLTSLFDGIYSGLKRFKSLSIIAMISGTISLIITYILVKEFKLIGAFLAIDFYYFLLFVLLVVVSRNFILKFDRDIFSRIWKYSAILGIAGIGHFLYTRANTIILGKFYFFSEVGYLEIIDKAFVLLSFPFLILSQIIAPQVTELTIQGKYSVVISYFKKILVYSIPITLSITFILWLIFPQIIKLFLPNYFTENFLSIFNLMIFNLPLLLITISLSQPFIIATGLAKYSLLILPFGILNVILSIFFITQFGFIGAIYSILITSISSKLLTYYFVYKKLSRLK